MHFISAWSETVIGTAKARKNSFKKLWTNPSLAKLSFLLQTVAYKHFPLKEATVRFVAEILAEDARA